MLRPSFHRLLALLGLLAAVFVATMPTLSRFAQSTPHAVAMTMPAGIEPGAEHAGHASQRAGSHGDPAVPADPAMPDHGGHALAACGYCLLPPPPLPAPGASYAIAFVPVAPPALGSDTAPLPVRAAVPALGPQAPPRA